VVLRDTVTELMLLKPEETSVCIIRLQVIIHLQVIIQCYPLLVLTQLMPNKEDKQT